MCRYTGRLKIRSKRVIILFSIVINIISRITLYIRTRAYVYNIVAVSRAKHEYNIIILFRTKCTRKYYIYDAFSSTEMQNFGIRLRRAVGRAGGDRGNITMTMTIITRSFRQSLYGDFCFHGKSGANGGGGRVSLNADGPRPETRCGGGVVSNTKEALRAEMKRDGERILFREQRGLQAGIKLSEHRGPS